MSYLTFSKIDAYGRTGNSIWQVAAVIGLAKRHGLIPLIPHRWHYRQYCSLPDEYYGDVTPDEIVKETQHHYIPDLLKDVKGKAISIEGCFQTTKYFSEIQEDLKRWLRPKEADNYGEWSVGVHIRRGDYVGHPCYAQYDANWYKAVMEKYFHDPRYVFYICSDDMRYIQKHFPADERHIYADRSVVSDLVVLTSCKHFILSGSSFSFWGAFLSTQPGGTIIRPPRTHVGTLSHLVEDDMWPANFISYNSDKEVVLLCYADSNYTRLQKRLVNNNETSKQFDKVFAYTREDLEATYFYTSHKELLDQERGGGYWLWKPYYILETLKQLQDGDILLYLDSGDMFFGDIRKFLVSELANRHIILTESGNIQKDYTKRDCFIEMDCDGKEYWDTNQVEAGVIAMKNSAKTRSLIKEWLGWCCQYHIIDDTPSVKGKEFDGFIETRHDQSILTNLKVSRNIYTSPDIRQFVACNVNDIGEGKIDLTDISWIIPVKFDHQDREDNLNIVLDWLQARFDTNIIVGEQGSNRHFQYVEKRGVQYMYFEMEMFHRTRMLNLMTVAAPTNIIINHDADVVLTIQGVIEAVEMLRKGSPFVYPYSGAFLRTPKQYHTVIHSLLGVESLIGIPFKGWNDGSVGGSVGFLRNVYIECGLEDEKFFSHAPEDVARVIMFKLHSGYKRVDYPLFHLDHFIGPDSHHNHEWAVFNHSEIRKVKSLKTKQDMLDYVQTMPWVREYKQKLGLL